MHILAHELFIVKIIIIVRLGKVIKFDVDFFKW